MPSQTPVLMNLLSCPVCCKKFTVSIRLPVSLGCGHIICHLCLKTVSDQLCPLDQEAINTNVDELPINFAVLQLVEEIENSEINSQSDNNSSDSLSSVSFDYLNCNNYENDINTDTDNNPNSIIMDKYKNNNSNHNNNSQNKKKINLKNIKKYHLKNQQSNKSNKTAASTTTTTTTKTKIAKTATSTTTNNNNNKNDCKKKLIVKTNSKDVDVDKNNNNDNPDSNKNDNDDDNVVDNDENVAAQSKETTSNNNGEILNNVIEDTPTTSSSSSLSMPITTPILMRSLSLEEKLNYQQVVETIEKLASHVKPHLTLLDNASGNSNVTPSTLHMISERNILSRPMQRKLLNIINCQLMENGGRMRGLRAARSLGERCVTELIIHNQNSQQLSSNLWAAVRARGCQFLGPSMQEEVLKLMLSLLTDGRTLSRKVLVLHVVEDLSKNYPQASKTSIGHVVQLLYRASCFKVSKRESESSLMQLKDEFRNYKALRREHDAQIVQIATEAGLRILPEQWSMLLYADANHKAHMQSICGKLQSPLTFAQALVEYNEALSRSNKSNSDAINLERLQPHLRYLAGIDPAHIEKPTWLELAKAIEAAHQLTFGLMEFLVEYAGIKKIINNNNNNNNANLIELNNLVAANGGGSCVSSNNSNNATPTNKYKVCLCRDLLTRGVCPRGISCTFAHSENELDHYRGMQRKLIDTLVNFSNDGRAPSKDLQLIPMITTTSVATTSTATTAVPTITTTNINNNNNNNNNKNNVQQEVVAQSQLPKPNNCQQLLTPTKSTAVGSSGKLSPMMLHATNTNTLSPYHIHLQSKPTSVFYEQQKKSGNSSMETSPHRMRSFQPQQQQQYQQHHHHSHFPPPPPPQQQQQQEQQKHHQLHHNYQQWSLMPRTVPLHPPMNPYNQMAMQQHQHQQQQQHQQYPMNMQQQPHHHHHNQHHHPQQQQAPPPKAPLNQRPLMPSFDPKLGRDDALQYGSYGRRHPLQQQQHQPPNMLPTQQAAYSTQHLSGNQANWWRDLQNKSQTTIMPHVDNNYNKMMSALTTQPHQQQVQQSKMNYRQQPMQQHQPFRAILSNSTTSSSTTTAVVTTTVATPAINPKCMESFVKAKSYNDWSDMLSKNKDTEYNALCEGVLASGLGVYAGFNKLNDLLNAGLLMPHDDQNQFVTDAIQQGDTPNANYHEMNLNVEKDTIRELPSTSHKTNTKINAARASPLEALMEGKAFHEKKNNDINGFFVRSDSILDDDSATTSAAATTSANASASENCGNKYGPICPMYKRNNNNKTPTPFLTGRATPSQLLSTSPAFQSSSLVVGSTSETKKYCAYNQQFDFNLDIGINMTSSLLSSNNSFNKSFEKLNTNCGELSDSHRNTTATDKSAPATFKDNTAMHNDNQDEAKVVPLQEPDMQKLDVFDDNTHEFNRKSDVIPAYMWKDPRSMNIENTMITMPVPRDVGSMSFNSNISQSASTSKSNPMKRRYQAAPPPRPLSHETQQQQQQHQQQQSKMSSTPQSVGGSRFQKPINFRYHNNNNHNNQLMHHQQKSQQPQPHSLERNMARNGHMSNTYNNNPSVSNNPNILNFTNNDNTNSTNIGFNLLRNIEREMASKHWPFNDDESTSVASPTTSNLSKYHKN